MPYAYIQVQPQPALQKIFANKMLFFITYDDGKRQKGSEAAFQVFSGRSLSTS